MFWSWPHFSNCVLGIKNSHLFICNISMVWFCFSELNFKLVMARTGVDLPKGLLFWKRISFDVFARFNALRFVMNVLNKTGTKCAILSKLSLFGYSMVLSRINKLFFLTFFSYSSLKFKVTFVSRCLVQASLVLGRIGIAVHRFQCQQDWSSSGVHLDLRLFFVHTLSLNFLFSLNWAINDIWHTWGT